MTTTGRESDVFPSSGIRKLARSEEMFAETHNFVGLAAHVRGSVDVDALAEAFDALLAAHPVLNGHLEQSPDGRWETQPAPPSGFAIPLDREVSLIGIPIRLIESMDEDRRGNACTVALQL